MNGLQLLVRNKEVPFDMYYGLMNLVNIEVSYNKYISTKINMYPLIYRKRPLF